MEISCFDRSSECNRTRLQLSNSNSSSLTSSKYVINQNSRFIRFTEFLGEISLVATLVLSFYQAKHWKTERQSTQCGTLERTYNRKTSLVPTRWFNLRPRCILLPATTHGGWKERQEGRKPSFHEGAEPRDFFLFVFFFYPPDGEKVGTMRALNDFAY